jgi:hypothetical protein
MKQTGTVIGRVVDNKGNPVTLAYLIVAVSSGREPDPQPYMVMEATTDESGRYRVGGIPTGVSCQVGASAELHGWDRTEAFALEDGQVYKVKDLVLEAADKSVEGTVTDAGGKPVARAEVTATGAQTGRRVARTDENGRYRLVNLMDEDVEISVKGPGPRRSLAGYGETTAMAGDEHADVILKPPITVELRVYRAHGQIRGETSLTEDVWAGIEEARRGPLRFFTLADLTIGDVTLRANHREWTWNGKSEPPEGGEIEPVSYPRLAVIPGKPGALRDVESVPIQYFERRADGLFELKETAVPRGVFFGVTAEQGESGRIVLHDLWIGSDSLVKRRPIEGVNLNIGQPIYEDSQLLSYGVRLDSTYDGRTFGSPIVQLARTTTVSVRPGRYYGTFLPTVGQGTLIARLRVDILDLGKGALYSEAD